MAVIYMTKQGDLDHDSARQVGALSQDWADARDCVRNWLLDGRDMSETDWSIDQLLLELADLALAPPARQQGE